MSFIRSPGFGIFDSETRIGTGRKAVRRATGILDTPSYSYAIENKHANGWEAGKLFIAECKKICVSTLPNMIGLIKERKLPHKAIENILDNFFEIKEYGGLPPEMVTCLDETYRGDSKYKHYFIAADAAREKINELCGISKKPRRKHNYRKNQ